LFVLLLVFGEIPNLREAHIAKHASFAISSWLIPIRVQAVEEAGGK